MKYIFFSFYSVLAYSTPLILCTHIDRFRCLIFFRILSDNYFFLAPCSMASVPNNTAPCDLLYINFEWIEKKIKNNFELSKRQPGIKTLFIKLNSVAITANNNVTHTHSLTQYCCEARTVHTPTPTPTPSTMLPIENVAVHITRYDIVIIVRSLFPKKNRYCTHFYCRFCVIKWFSASILPNRTFNVLKATVVHINFDYICEPLCACNVSCGNAFSA